MKSKKKDITLTYCPLYEYVHLSARGGGGADPALSGYAPAHVRSLTN